MGLERFQPVQPQDNAAKSIDAPSTREFVALNTALMRVLKRVTDCPLLDGRLIQGISFTSGVAMDLPHGLGRRYLGFFLVRSSNDLTLDEAYSAPQGDKFINLTPSATVTADLWVF
jgi:hypothetical protein